MNKIYTVTVKFGTGHSLYILDTHPISDVNINKSAMSWMKRYKLYTNYTVEKGIKYNDT